MMAPRTASAEDPVIIPIEGLDAVYVSGDFDVSYPVGTSTVQTATQCVSIPGTPLTNFCSGTATPGADVPLEVGGIEDRTGLVKHNAAANDALDWIVAEGQEALRAMYDVPNDDRIGRYARSELRSYMVERLLDIMDRKVYGLPLTSDEQAALDFVQREVAEDDLILAQAAYDEFREYQNLTCDYRPPPKPASVATAVPRPKKMVDWCSVAHHPTAEAFMFAPPMPSVEHFNAWGAYRASTELGLDVLADEKVADIARDATLGLVALGGLAVALGAAGVTAAIVGSSAALSGVVVAVIGSHAAVSTFVGSGVVPGGVIAGSTAGVGAAAAASVVAVVVIFVIVTAVSIWLLVQNESIGKTLKENLDNALKETDPLGLGEEAEDLSGKPLRSEFDPADPPSYREGAAVSKLLGKVVQWTSVFEAPPAAALATASSSASTTSTTSTTAAASPGLVVGDPEGLWANHATSASDIKFITRTGTGDPVQTNRITVPQEPGAATVRFSRGWMVVDSAITEPEATLSFGYIDAEGKPRLAARAPSTVGGFIVTDPAASGGVEGEHVEVISYRNEQGQLVRARLKPRSYQYLDGPRPAAIGPLLAGRVVILRPNPVNLNGTTYDMTEAQTDFTYEWTVRKFDSESGTWAVVHTSSEFGGNFTPTSTGLYDARVTMTSIENPAVQKHGYVSFPIAAPPMTTTPFTLLDNGSTQLEIDLQVVEAVSNDTVTVDVTWPGEFGQADNPTQQLVLPCFNSDILECTTQRTGPSNLLTFDMTQRTDLRRPVTVTLTNSFGATITQEFFIDTPIRPEVLPPPAGSNDGMPGSVTVGEDSTQVSMPLRLAANSSYVVGVLDPGDAGGPDFGMFDPATNNTTAAIPVPGMEQVFVKLDETDAGIWELYVEGIVHPRDLGTYEVPVVLQQTGDLSRTAIVVVIHVVPSAGDRYRGGLQSPVDPDDFAVASLPDLRPAILGGLAQWAPYTGNMCVSLRYAGPAPAAVKCAPASAFFKADGSAYRFPYAELFPTGMPSGSYAARAWLTKVAGKVDTTPLETSFFLTADATYPRPQARIGAVTLDGTAKVDNRLRAVVASVHPTDATVTYKWLRDGIVMPGKTAPTYLVRAGDVGHRLSVQVIAKKQYWVTARKTSAPSAIVTN